MSHDVISVLLDILIVLVAAKLAAEVAERLRIPAVVGEILAGILVGPSVLGLVGNGDVLRTLGELGVVLLLLEVGMEMDLAELGRVGKVSLTVAVIGVVAPLVLGLGAMSAIGDDFNTALFVAAALTATSVGITARVFGDLGALSTSEARVVLGAAVADDVIGLVVLTVVVRVVTQGTISVVGVAGVLAGAVAFLVVGGALALWIAPHLFSWLERVSRSAGTLVALALAFTLALAELADVASLAVVVGAFLAGLALGRTRQSNRIRRELAPVGHLFIPVFFLAIGIDVDVSALLSVSVLRDAAILLVVAIVGKLIAAVGVAGTRNDRLLVGLGMLPRGEVGLIFATIGLNAGVLGDDLYAALLLVVLVTTLVTPVLLRSRYQRIQAGAPAADDAGEPEPEDGWLVVRDGAVALAAVPGSQRVLEIALTAARRVVGLEPDAGLLDWFADHRNTSLVWTDRARDDFIAVLRDGNARSWRFLEALDVLPRAFPELEPALRDRRSDPLRLDATGLHHWDALERLQAFARTPAGAAEWERARGRDMLRLVAFLVDLLDDREDRAAVALQVAERLELGSRQAQSVATLVDGPRLLLDASRRRSFDEYSVMQLAGHYGDPGTARGAFLLASALADGSADGGRLRELYDLVVEVLRAANWRGDWSDLVQDRRREAARASDGSDAALRRIDDAPRRYLLVERPRRVARHAELLAGWRRRGPQRYLVTVEPPSRHHDRVTVDVVGPDRPGLLARVTRVLADAGLDIEHAVVATWPDGCALSSFLVRTTTVPDAAALRDAIRAAAGAQIVVPAVAGVGCEFDDAASPWSTRARVRARDARGVLSAVTGAFAAAGVEIHSAEIVAEGGEVVDTFELTREGEKLSPGDRDAVIASLEQGAVVPRRRRTLARVWEALRSSWSSANGQPVDVNTSSL